MAARGIALRAVTDEFGAAVRSKRTTDQPDEKGTATVKLTTMTQVHGTVVSEAGERTGPII